MHELRQFADLRNQTELNRQRCFMRFMYALSLALSGRRLACFIPTLPAMYMNLENGKHILGTTGPSKFPLPCATVLLQKSYANRLVLQLGEST